MSIVIGQDIGRKLSEALGLPKNTISFTLRAKPNQVVTVECVYAPEGDAYTAELAEFVLIPRPRAQVPPPPPAHPAEALGYDAWLQQRNDRAHRQLMAHAIGIDYGK